MIQTLFVRRIFILILFSSLILASGCKNEGIIIPGNTEYELSADTVRVLDNPLNGWVMYLNRNWDEAVWEKQGYDRMPADSGRLTVKVSDYASVAYLRTSWSAMEPEEGKYFWKDPDSRLCRLLKSVRDRGMKLAFRVVVDGRDQGANTPDYVFDAGAGYYLQNPGRPDMKTPYPQDPVFRKCYEKFIEAFAEEFNDPDVTAFIDGYGLGKWGEGHNVVYEPGNIISDSTSYYKENTMRWITGLYSRTFTKIPLAINYHRHIGAPVSEGSQVDPDSEHLLQIAIDNGYCLRADSFGMNNQDWGYNDWERSFVKKWACRLPVIMEGGWIVGQHSWWNDPAGYETPRDVRIGEFTTSEEEKVNMMDFRAGAETTSWFNDAFDLVTGFLQEGVYRLYPNQLYLPETVQAGSSVTVRSRWSNLGNAYFPADLKQWEGRYKMAYALLDRSSGEPVRVFVDDAAALQTVVKNQMQTFDTEIGLSDVPAGSYTWGIAIVNTQKDNVPAVEMAVREESMTASGWLKLLDVTVQ